MFDDKLRAIIKYEKEVLELASRGRNDYQRRKGRIEAFEEALSMFLYHSSVTRANKDG